MTPQTLSQKDPRWANKKLGTGNIADRGCTVTCLAMFAGTTPDKIVDEASFTPQGAIYWATLKSLKFHWRGYSYENDEVKEAIDDFGGCLVEVDNSGTYHWVLYIGNKRMIDPLTGRECSTSKYKPTGYCVLEPLAINNEPMLNLSDEIIGKSSQRDKVVSHYEFKIGTAKDDELLIKIQQKISGLRGEITKKETEITELKEKLENKPPLLEGKRKLLAGIVSSVLVFVSKLIADKMGVQLSVAELALISAGGLSYVGVEGTKDVIEVLKGLRKD